MKGLRTHVCVRQTGSCSVRQKMYLNVRRQLFFCIEYMLCCFLNRSKEYQYTCYSDPCFCKLGLCLGTLGPLFRPGKSVQPANQNICKVVNNSSFCHWFPVSWSACFDPNKWKQVNFFYISFFKFFSFYNS